MSTAVLLLAALLPGTAATGGAQPYVVEARKAYRDMDDQRVQLLLGKALAQTDRTEEIVEIYGFLALTHVTFHRDQKAVDCYVEILRRSPPYQPPPQASPKLRDAFRRAQAVVVKELRPPPAAPSAVPLGPTSAPPPPPAVRAPPIYARWWFWTAIAVAVVGAGAVTTYEMTRPSSPTLDYGPYHLP